MAELVEYLINRALVSSALDALSIPFMFVINSVVKIKTYVKY